MFRRGAASLLVIVGLGLLGTDVALAGSIDAVLERMLGARLQRPADAPPQVPVWVDATGLLQVPVIIDGVPARVAPAVAAAGGRVRAVVAGRYVTADLPLSTTRAVARAPGVWRVKAGVRVRPWNDLGSLPGGVGARGPEQPSLAPPYAASDPDVARAHAGQGVVVALVDTGVDFAHPDLRHEDGSTRLLAYWDQSDPTTRAGDHPDGLGYGRLYEAADLDAILEGRARLGSTARDTRGHGTHVAGTLAGAGRARPGAPYADHQFTGVAPRASLVAVKFDCDGPRGDTTALVDAVDFCLRRAGALPCVVNLGLGTERGPHDGSTPEERALDALTGPGRVVVVAAGNGGGSGSHGAGTLAPGRASELSADLTASASTDDAHVLWELWLPARVAWEVEVVTPDGEVVRDARWRAGAGGAGRATRHGRVFVHDGPGPDELGDPARELYVELRGAPDAPLATGRWTIRLRGTPGAPAARYDAWHGLSRALRGSCMRYEGRLPDDHMTIAAPATGRRMLAVGAYATRTAWSDGRGGVGAYDPAWLPAIAGDLASFSGRGPSRDGRRLPHVTAPGVGVISSLSRHARGAFAPEFMVGPWLRARYAVLQGTSVAAPHAAGVVALALAIDPTLTPEDVMDLIGRTARVDDQVLDGLFALDPGPPPNDDWGAGKLDAPRLLATVAARARARAERSPPTTAVAPLTDAARVGSIDARR